MTQRYIAEVETVNLTNLDVHFNETAHPSGERKSPRNCEPEAPSQSGYQDFVILVVLLENCYRSNNGFEL